MAKNLEIANRLREFGKKQFGSMQAFADALDMSQESISQYVNGKSLPGNKLQAKLRELGCDIEWLMTGERTALSFDTQLTAYYPVVSHIRAGNGTVSEPVIEWQIKSSGPSGKEYKGSMFFEVKGDSMVPRWEEGDLVLVNPNVKPKHGEYGIVCWDNEDGALKKVYYRDERIHLQSINPAYETIVVNPADVWFIAKILLTKHKE